MNRPLRTASILVMARLTQSAHRCFHTVATTTREADLQTAEQKHTCAPADKLRFELVAEAAKLHFLKGAS